MSMMYLINDIGMVESMMGDSAIEDINALLKQLSPNVKNVSQRHLKDVMHFSDLIWAVNKDTMSVIGIITLTRVYKPTAFFGTMEDLIVDTEYQHQGIGTELINMLLKEARRQGMAYVDFTSRPDRVDANKRYLEMNAIKKETNMYRFELK